MTREPWDTPTAHTPTPPTRPETPQPNTCRHCNTPTLTATIHGLPVHLHPTPLTPSEQIHALLTNQTLYSIGPATPTRFSTTITRWIHPLTRAQRLLGTPTNNTDHPTHATHRVHQCARSTQ